MNIWHLLLAELVEFIQTGWFPGMDMALKRSPQIFNGVEVEDLWSPFQKLKFSLFCLNS